MGLQQQENELLPGVAVDARVALIVRLEWLLLILRYGVFLFFLGAYSLGNDSAHLIHIILLCLAMLLHNFFAHWVLYTGRYAYFFSRTNFSIYLILCTLTIAATGADTSLFAPAYILIMIGYTTYQPGFLSVYRVTLLCCIAYTAAIIFTWLLVGVNVHYSPSALNLGLILMSGWLLNTLNAMMAEHRYEAESRAMALASSEAMLRTVLDSAADPIILFDDEEFIVDVNRRACEFFDLNIGALLGRRFRSFFFDDGTFPTKLASVRSRGRYHSEELALMPQGEERMVDMVVQAFLREKQRYFVAMLHDITEQKSAEEAARLSTLQLEQANRELQKVNELRMEFFLTVSKRLRSPLSSVLGFADLLLEEDLGAVNEEQRKALQSCRRSVYRVFSMMDEALQWDADPIREPAEKAEEGAESTKRAH